MVNCECTPLHYAAQGGHAGLVRLLAESWPEGPREEDDEGNTPLHLAAQMGKTDVVRLLVEIWPEGKEPRNECGKTPLSIFE
jgi:ankyrin repeat protein